MTSTRKQSYNFDACLTQKSLNRCPEKSQGMFLQHWIPSASILKRDLNNANLALSHCKFSRLDETN